MLRYTSSKAQGQLRPEVAGSPAAGPPLGFGNFKKLLAVSESMGII